MRDATFRLLQDYYASFNRREWKTFLGLLTEDIAHDVNQGARETGREAFSRFMERMNICYAEQIVDLEIMPSADGCRAAVEFTVVGSYLRTDEGLPPARGQRYRLAGGAFFDIREGKVARVSNYYNLQDWLQQVSAG